MQTGEARIDGPMTKEDKTVWDELRKRLDASHEEIKELTKLAADPESASYRHLVEADIELETQLRDRIQNVIGDWPYKRGKRQKG